MRGAGRDRWWSRLVQPVVWGVAALALAGCNDKNSYAEPPPAKVTVATPTEAPVTLYAEFTGNTAPYSVVDLEARVQGYLTAIGYRDGEVVKKDRVLFEIEKAQYEGQVEQQKAQLQIARATQANAKREYERQAELGTRQVASQRTVDDAQTALDTANGQVASAEAGLMLAQTSYGYTTVKAPFAGVVTRHLADVGSLVGSSGPTKLATILQVDPILVYFNMSEQQQIDMRDALAAAGKTLRDMRETPDDMPIEAALAQDKTFDYSGHIDYIAPQLDAATGTLQMRAELPNKDVRLVPGQFVRVRVAIGKIDAALLVNDTAIQSNQTGSYVMVIGADNVVEQRQVTTGAVVGQLRVISSGLKATDKVAIGSIQRAVAGSTVAPVEGAMEPMPDKPKPAPGALAPASGSTTSAP